jgi:hypothetical protein
VNEAPTQNNKLTFEKHGGNDPCYKSSNPATSRPTTSDWISYYDELVFWDLEMVRKHACNFIALRIQTGCLENGG